MPNPATLNNQTISTTATKIILPTDYALGGRIVFAKLSNTSDVDMYYAITSSTASAPTLTSSTTNSNLLVKATDVIVEMNNSTAYWVVSATGTTKRLDVYLFGSTN